MENHTGLLFLFGALFVLWVLYFWFYWQYRVEKTRQELFFIRNELFDYAAAGNIEFKHPAYGLLREMMNSMIRFTHKFELITLICLFVALRKTQPEKGRFNMLMKEIEVLPSEMKEKFENYILHVNMILASHLIKSSIILMVLIGIFGFFISIHVGWHNLKYEVKRRFPYIEQIDNIAAELG